MPRNTKTRAPAKQSSSPKRRAKGTPASTSNAAQPTIPAPRRFRGRGQLKMLPEMPLDILFEIFSHLDPPDVLRLARTTKDLRELLMSRSAISIWKAAFLNDPDLPCLPEGMNEPQYANLAFSPHCHSCFVAGEHSILWAFQVRLCSKCMEGRFDESYKVFKKVPGKSMSLNITLLRHATAIIPTGSRFVYSYDEVVEMHEKLATLKKGDSKKYEEFCDKRRKWVEEIQAHASQAQMSGSKRLARIQRMREEARERRRIEVYKRLGDLGYTDEVEYINDTRPEMLSEHSLIKSDVVLTDRVWDNMKPQLVELMHSVTEKMQRRKRKSVLKKRQRLLLSILKAYIHERPMDEIHPRAVDVCVMPHIKAMLEDASMDAYTTEESFQDLVDDLPAAEDRDFLLRATTYFRCAECREPIAYPRILAHACLSELQHGHRNRDDDDAILFTNLESEPWNYGGKRVTYYPDAEASAKSVVHNCGLDVDMTTAQDMDDVSPWLECICCRHKVNGRAVFRWRKAILHDMYHAALGDSSNWRPLSDSHAEAAEALQQTTFQACYNDPPDNVCTRCRHQSSYLQMRTHLRISHGIDDPEIEEDYVLQVDASMDQPPFTLMLPHSLPEIIELDDDERPSKPLKYSGNSIVIEMTTE
ncbi:F-box domain-containing protein [Mycena venus]|uniref:F-box domain-containing protein n=1 Tax=Mycena venus TaxID=2733690 RepID=A0A8H7CJ10_9AGAR|nr:F-box domain-containing protein [Mycena venus]